MTIPIWTLFVFAIWTILLLLFTVGIYRWSHIITGKKEIKSFRADKVEGHDWYRRAMRAHANCIENLPVYGTIVFVIYVTGLEGFLLNVLAIHIPACRVVQSLVHVSFVESNRTVSIRFTFYFIQLICMLWMCVLIIKNIL